MEVTNDQTTECSDDNDHMEQTWFEQEDCLVDLKDKNSSAGADAGSEDAEEEDFEYEYDESLGDFYFQISNQVTPSADEEMLFNIDPVECTICFTRADSGMAVRLVGSCGHFFCFGCFRRYIQARVDEGQANMISCPLPDCGRAVAETVLNEVLNAQEKDRLQRCSTSAFVLKSDTYHHCPTADCQNVLYWKEGYGPPIGDCFQCEKTSCLKCGAVPYHQGDSCEDWKAKQAQMACARLGGQLSRIVDRSRADEELTYTFQPTEEWLDKLNIRVCRRCVSGVELSDGCYKMKCRCGYRFCFFCGSENAQCGCTPAHHGFTDNRMCYGDFSGLHQVKSYT